MALTGGTCVTEGERGRADQERSWAGGGCWVEQAGSVRDQRERKRRGEKKEWAGPVVRGKGLGYFREGKRFKHLQHLTNFLFDQDSIKNQCSSMNANMYLLLCKFKCCSIY